MCGPSITRYAFSIQGRWLISAPRSKCHSLLVFTRSFMLLMSVAILLMYIGRSKYAHASCRTGLLRLLNIFNFPFNGKIFLRNKAWYFLKKFRTVFGFKRFKNYGTYTD